MEALLEELEYMLEVGEITEQEYQRSVQEVTDMMKESYENQ